MKLSLEDGEFLVKAARKSIEDHLREETEFEPSADYPEKMDENRGVFVTLNKYPSGELRGCVGFVEPIKPLITAVEEAAVLSATNDVRFPSLELEELENVTLEVTVLTKPELIETEEPREYLGKIEVGRDGLIVKAFGKVKKSGLLLPQVPTQYGWNPEKFLNQTCKKAGLLPKAWKSGDVEVHKFQGQLFSEQEPNGEVKEKSLGEVSET